MDDTESLAHTKWECKYHVVWIPTYRRQALYAELRKYLGPVLRELARQREAVVEEGHL
jgi:putative transposase